MTISFTFRHMEPSESIKSYAGAKLMKLQKLLLHPMSAKITFAIEKQRHVAEVQLDSGPEHVEAKESCEELYASIDQVIDKVERQIHVIKGEKIARNRRPSETIKAAKVAAESVADSPDRERVSRKAADD